VQTIGSSAFLNVAGIDGLADNPGMGSLDERLEKFRDFIERAEKRTGWSPTRIAEEAKMRHHNITRRLSGQTTSAPKIETIRKIEAATGEPYDGNQRPDVNESADDSHIAESYREGTAERAAPSEVRMTGLKEAVVELLSRFDPTEASEILEMALERRAQKRRPSPTSAGRM
jgi:hypothetical protein